MQTQYKYQASASWTLHRHGFVKAGDGIPFTLDFSVPPEFGGEGGMWTPEHLLLAAVASCFAATFRGMAEKSNLDFQTIEIAVEGIIEKKEGSLRFTKIILHPEALICREEDRARAVRLLDKAEQSCLVARSLSAEIEMQPQIWVEAPTLV
jgi:peroxiredoxin-like protein